MVNENKQRLLKIYKLLMDRTDENHTLSTVQLIKLLEDEYGMQTHRVTIAKDIKILQDSGIDIGVIESTQNKYYIAGRQFETPEVKMLIDAVASSKVITAKKSKELIKKLSLLTSPMKARELKRNIAPDDRIKAKNENILYVVDAINDAINERRKVSFKYFCYDANKKKRIKNDGNPYVFSPYELIWNGDYYYAVGWSEKHDGIGAFRVDRISSVPVLLEDKIVPVPERFNAAEYIKINYHMFGGGEAQIVELLCDNSVMDAIIDRFGIDVETIPSEDGKFKATVLVAVNNVFFGWIFGFDGAVRIIRPDDVLEQYQDMVKRA